MLPWHRHGEGRSDPKIILMPIKRLGENRFSNRDDCRRPPLLWR